MDLTVARAVAITGLLKTDHEAPDLRRDDANLFIKTLLRTINVCTNTNACKSFIIRYVLPSPARTAVLIKYLTAVARNCAPEDAGSQPSTISAEELEGVDRAPDDTLRSVSPLYRSLHLLYIIHDIVSSAKLKTKKDQKHADIFQHSAAAIEELITFITVLSQLAVCSDGKATHVSKQSLAKVELLLREWKKHNIIPADSINTLQKSLQSAHDSSWQELLTKLADNEAQAAVIELRAKEEATKWLIPKTNHLPHDPTAEWHELPATNGLFQRRTHGFPLRAAAFPPGGYSLERGGQYADEATKRKIESLLDNMRHCYDKYTNAEEVEDIDELGNFVWKVETGRKRRNHWGWSYDGIEQRRLEEAQWAAKQM